MLLGAGVTRCHCVPLLAILRAAIRECHVFLPIITSEYLDVDRMHGRLQWEGQTDWCRKEIEQAMSQEYTTIIPYVAVGFHEEILAARVPSAIVLGRACARKLSLFLGVCEGSGERVVQSGAGVGGPQSCITR